MNKLSVLRNHGGFGLVQVLVAIGIAGILAVVVTDLMSSQQKQVRLLTDQLTKIDIKNQVERLLSTPGFCSCLLKGTTYDAATNKFANVAGVYPIPRIPNQYSAAFPTCTPGPTDALRVNTNLPGTQRKVQSITIQNLAPIMPALPDREGEIQVLVGTPNETMVIAPIQIKLRFNLSPAGAVLACNVFGSGTATLPTTYTRSNDGGDDTTVCCDPGDARIGCSGSRQVSLADNCDESDCGYIGTHPTAPNCCRTTIDTAGTGQSAVAFAYCLGH